MKAKKLTILGTRGVPASHGGFETLAQKLALFLVEKNKEVTVACQYRGFFFRKAVWSGVSQKKIGVPITGSLGSILFDLVSFSTTVKSTVLVLGYNTGLFNIILKLLGNYVIVNMDGIEYDRSKYGKLAKLWLRVNEFFAILFSDIVIADHPEIKRLLETKYPGLLKKKKPIVIGYGGETEQKTSSSKNKTPKKPYILTVCRIVPENNLDTIIDAFINSKLKKSHDLVILGNLDPKNSHHKMLLYKLNKYSNIKTPGAIYEQQKVLELRGNAACYVHGHSVGGTNPSLVEAMQHSANIIAHDNPFNKWVLDGQGLYFRDTKSLKILFDKISERKPEKVFFRVKNELTWDYVCHQYKETLRL